MDKWPLARSYGIENIPKTMKSCFTWGVRRRGSVDWADGAGLLGVRDAALQQEQHFVALVLEGYPRRRLHFCLAYHGLALTVARFPRGHWAPTRPPPVKVEPAPGLAAAARPSRRSQASQTPELRPG